MHLSEIRRGKTLKNKKTVILLSGGIDSATCLAMLLNNGEKRDDILALNIHYGQRNSMEHLCAMKLCEHYKIKLKDADISSVFRLSESPLLLHSKNDIPRVSYEEQKKDTINNVIDTYVPFRNGVMLSIAASIGYSIGADKIYYGANLDDYSDGYYPDCSLSFVSSMGEAIRNGTGDRMILYAPLVNMNKKEIISTGIRLGVPYQYTWSCYEKGDTPCGVCSACRLRKAAFESNGVEDYFEVIQL